ncbi:MAG TPA: GGDEF domain-containing protein [Anaerolineales bacterium]|jgi:diguanylate cyclase (GGDEF)-like protein/PAS domain S-box-containing protein
MSHINKNTFEKMSHSELIFQIEKLSQHLQELITAREEHRQAVEALLEKEEEYRILLDESSDPIFTFYPDGTYRYVNRAFADGVAKPLESIIGKKIWDVFPKDEADKRFAAVKWVFENGETKVLEVRVPRQDGDRYYLTTVKPIFNDDKKVISVLCISKEITERKRMEDELRFLGTHDSLTGLYNRHFFQEELARFQNSRLYPVSIVMADLDGLKAVNDRLGHAAGDELIRKAAIFLKDSFRSEDIIARIGGDEYIVLLPATSQAEVEEIIARLQISMHNQGNPVFNLSIGSATSENDESLHDVMQRADAWMYHEKAQHRTQP